MLKKILYTIAIVFGSILSSTAQLSRISPIDTVAIDTTVVHSNSEVVETFSVHNQSATDTMRMKWHVDANSFPHGWSLQICDPHDCYSVYSGTYSFTFLPNATSIFKVDVYPNCISSNGYFKVHVWAPSDSIHTTQNLVWNFNVNAACVSGIRETEVVQISMYPNPVKNTLTISVPQVTSNAKLEVYNLIGSKVYSKDLNARETEQEFDLSNLDGGIYVARISENGKVVTTRRFNKAD